MSRCHSAVRSLDPLAQAAVLAKERDEFRCFTLYKEDIVKAEADLQAARAVLTRYQLWGRWVLSTRQAFDSWCEELRNPFSIEILSHGIVPEDFALLEIDDALSTLRLVRVTFDHHGLWRFDEDELQNDSEFEVKLSYLIASINGVVLNYEQRKQELEELEKVLASGTRREDVQACDKQENQEEEKEGKPVAKVRLIHTDPVTRRRVSFEDLATFKIPAPRLNSRLTRSQNVSRSLVDPLSCPGNDATAFMRRQRAKG